MAGDALTDSYTKIDEDRSRRLAVPGAAGDADEVQKLSVCVF